MKDFVPGAGLEPARLIQPTDFKLTLFSFLLTQSSYPSAVITRKLPKIYN